MAESVTRTIGKYRLYGKIGSGGMGSVHLGRIFAPGGFRRIVAIKRLHPQFAEDAAFVTAFLEEARLASRIHHPNVVAPLDVVAEDGEVFLVFEHVLGVSLAALVRAAVEQGTPVPPHIIASMMVDVLHGLHAAHEAKGDDGQPLGLVHRDVSPQNVLVGRDGNARLLDFGIAKATGRSQITEEGIVKGKRGYMAPEHLMGAPTQASDLYSAGVMLWEVVAGRRLFADDASMAARLSARPVPPPSTAARVALKDATIRHALDTITLRALAHDVATRFSSAREMAIALEQVGVATSREVGEWVGRVAHDELEERARLVERAESPASVLPDPPSSAVVTAPTLGIEPMTADVASMRDLDTGDPPSLASSAPASSALTARRRATRVTALLGLLGLVALGGVVLAFALRSRSAAPSANLAPERSAERGEGLPATVTSASASASASTVDVNVEPTAPAATTPGKPHTTTRARPARRRSDAPCKPYMIDKSGRTQFNEDCLR